MKSVYQRLGSSIIILMGVINIYNNFNNDGSIEWAHAMTGALAHGDIYYKSTQVTVVANDWAMVVGHFH